MKIMEEKLNLNQTILLNKLEQQKLNSPILLDNLSQKQLQNQNKSQNTNIADALKNLFSELFSNTKSDKVLLNILKNIPIFKTFEHFGSETKKLIELIETKNIKNLDLNSLKSILIDMHKLDETKIKHILEKSILSSETKSLLHTLSIHSNDEEVQNQANKMLSQIEYFQLTSYLNHSLHTYLPFDWDDFKEGDIEFKKESEEQYICHINVELQEYGKLKINILYEHNHLSLGFFIENETLKEKISSNLPHLRQSLKENNFIVQNISLISLEKDDENRTKLSLFGNENIHNFGLDLKV